MGGGDFIVAIVLEGLGIWIIINSYKLGLQTFSKPGSGLYPFLLGIILCLLAIPVFVSSLKNFLKTNIKKEGEEIEYHTDLKKVCGIIVCLTSYYLIFEILGFLITSFLFLFALFWMSYPRKWWLIFALTGASLSFAYLIFDIILNVPFPSGF